MERKGMGGMEKKSKTLTPIDFVRWVDKYQPRHLSDVVGQGDLVSKLQTMIEKKADIPPLLFAGTPGTGKTSILTCLTRTLFPDNSEYSDAVLVVNASNDRGLSTMTETLERFMRRQLGFLTSTSSTFASAPASALASVLSSAGAASTAASGSNGSMLGCRRRIVFLDEADSLTPAAQQALRYWMDTEAKHVLFLLACNQVKNVIEPIVSRCLSITFLPLGETDIRIRLQSIIEAEKMTGLVTAAGLQALLSTCEGDLRQAISLLQAAWVGHGRVDEGVVEAIACRPPMELLKALLLTCVRSDMTRALRDSNDEAIRDHTVPDVFYGLQSACLELLLPRRLHARMMTEVSESLIRVGEANIWSWLQLEALLARLCALAREDKEESN